MKIFFLQLLLFTPLLLFSQVGVNTDTPEQTLHVNGKLKVADDSVTPTAGTIRFNSSTQDFEGYDGTSWVSLTIPKNPAYVVSPVYSAYILPDGSTYDVNSDNTFFFEITFSEAIDPTSVTLGSTLLIDGSNPVSGSVSWSAGNTILRFESTTSFFDALNGTTCSIPVTVKGSAALYVTGENGQNIDGDSDGAPGGDYVLFLGWIC